MSIDRSRPLERTLPGLFVELAQAGTPDYLEAAIERASSRPQRPAWTFPERWIPVQLATSRVPTTRMPWRQLGVLALIALLMAAAVAVYIGTRPARLPPPFGPAANGVVIYSANGEIFAADPVTGDIRAIITGPEEDLRPIFSPDGTKFAFERVSSGTRDLYVARSDGTALTRVTAEPITLTASNVGDPYQFSPDGRSLIFAGSLGDKSARALPGRIGWQRSPQARSQSGGGPSDVRDRAHIPSSKG